MNNIRNGILNIIIYLFMNLSRLFYLIRLTLVNISTVKPLDTGPLGGRKMQHGIGKCLEISLLIHILTFIFNEQLLVVDYSNRYTNREGPAITMS